MVMTVSYNKSSPYYGTYQTSWYLDFWQQRPIPPSSKDLFIEVEPKHHQRPDLLSFELYDTSEYWWVFMVRNRDLIEDPIYDLVAGMKIWVPSKNYLKTIMG
jgi:hypothetical protein